MSTPVGFPYTHVAPAMAAAGWMPLLPITFWAPAPKVTEVALVDSGSAVNVLPYDLGVRLGLDWNRTTGTAPLTGTLASFPSKPVALDVVIASYPPVRLVFAWTQAPFARLLLGQMNFFLEFDICFFRRRGEFHLQPATP